MFYQGTILSERIIAESLIDSQISPHMPARLR